VIVVVGAPVWLALACLVDVARGKPRLPSARVVAFGVAFVCIECTVLFLTLVDTLRLRGGALIDATYARQQTFTRLILRAVERIFRIRVLVDGDACVTPGPVLVLARHASIVDTVLPNVIVTQQRGVRLRFVLKRELLEDPCLDVAGMRLPNHFVSRSSETHDADLRAIEQLAHGLGAHEGMLIYPEGTRFTAEKARRAREESGSALTHTLPAKPGGTLAALAGAPTADVVFLAHRGLDGFAHVKDIWSGAMLDRLVTVWLWRVPRTEIPTDANAQKRWLADAWARVDRAVAEMPA
jgi:1-acyl-sn-glycerol-3-phosphate acyltransferase